MPLNKETNETNEFVINQHVRVVILVVKVAIICQDGEVIISVMENHFLLK